MKTKLISDNGKEITHDEVCKILSCSKESLKKKITWFREQGIFEITVEMLRKTWKRGGH